jgi:hypothetical protein
MSLFCTSKMSQKTCIFHTCSNSKDEGIQSNRNTRTQTNANVVIFFDMKVKLSPSPHGRTFSGGMSSGRAVFQFAGGGVRLQGHCSSLPQSDFSSEAIGTVLRAIYVGPLPIQNVHSVVTSQIQFTCVYRRLTLNELLARLRWKT